MPLGDGDSWNESNPSGSSSASSIDEEIRDLRVGTRIRVSKEHATLENSSAGGEHKAGSAVAYSQSAAPTTRPDGSTSLTSGDAGRLWHDTDDNGLYIWSGTSWNQLHTDAYVRIIQEAGFSAHGGGLTASTWTKRNITSEESDSAGICSVDTTNDTFALPAGRYRVHIECVAYAVGAHQARLYNGTDGVTTLLGTTGFAPSTSPYGSSTSVISGEFTLASSKTFRVDHLAEVTNAASGQGRAHGISGQNNVYMTIEIWKIG